MSGSKDWLKGPNWQGKGGGGAEPGFPMPRLGNNLLSWAVILIPLWFLWTLFYTVQPEERAVVQRFGRVITIADPGLHFKLPFGIDNIRRVATERVLKQEFGFRSVGQRGDDGRTLYSDQDFPDESLMLTGDLNIIDVEWVVHYRIAEPIKYLYSMREPERTLRDISESVMRRVVGNRVGSEVLTTARAQIATVASDEIESAMKRYDSGIHVITVELQDVVPPARVKPAFNEVNEARQERERMINEATKQANQEIPRAQGEANRQISQAEGYATERINRAHGDTARFSAVLAEYRNAPEVTRTRMYLETLQKVLPNVGSVVVVQDGQQLPPLPLLNLKGTAAPAPVAGGK